MYIQTKREIIKKVFWTTFIIIIFLGSRAYASECQKFSSIKRLQKDTIVYVCGIVSKSLQSDYYELKQDKETLIIKIDHDFKQTASSLVGKKLKVRGVLDREKYPDYDEYELSIKARTIQIGDSKEILVEI